MTRPVLILLASLFLMAGTFKTLDRELASLIGQPISVAIDRLGLPDSEAEIAGEKVYTWSLSTVTAWTGDAQLSCRIRLSTNSSSIITRKDYFGNRGACSHYSKLLKRSAAAKKR